MRKAVKIGGALLATGILGAAIYNIIKSSEKSVQNDLSRIIYPHVVTLDPLDRRITELAINFRSDSISLLKELIRLPLDTLSTDSKSGTSGHEGPRLQYLKQRIVELGAVRSAEDVFFDDFGNLIWIVTNPEDPVPLNERRVIYLDGRADTGLALPDDWTTLIGSGIDPYNGLSDILQIDEHQLRTELNFLPRHEFWDSLVFGRGSADPLAGLVCQVFATRILLETISYGSLSNCVVISVASVSGLTLNGVGSNSIITSQLPPYKIPDVVFLSAPTGTFPQNRNENFAKGNSKSKYGPLGLYIGQEGHTLLNITVRGHPTVNSARHSYPMGSNTLEAGSLIANDALNSKYSPNLTIISQRSLPGDHGPVEYSLCLQRKTHKGESANNSSSSCEADIELLPVVSKVRNEGFEVNISTQVANITTWQGKNFRKQAHFPAYYTPPRHHSVNSMVEAWKRVVEPQVASYEQGGFKDDNKFDSLRRKERLGYWKNPTDGAGYVLRLDEIKFSIEGKGWIEEGEIAHPPIIGCGPGFEEHVGVIGEYVNGDHMWASIALMARFPSIFSA